MNSPEGTLVTWLIIPAMLLLLSLSVVSTQAQSQASDNSTKPTLRTPGDIAQALRVCFIPPPAENTYHGMRITLRLSFNRKGEILGQPHITYATPSAPEKVQTAYGRAMLDSVSRCTPLTFAPELGEAFAGQPITCGLSIIGRVRSDDDVGARPSRVSAANNAQESSCMFAEIWRRGAGAI